MLIVYFKISFTLYPAHSRICGGDLVLRHSIYHFLLIIIIYYHFQIFDPWGYSGNKGTASHCNRDAWELHTHGSKTNRIRAEGQERRVFWLESLRLPYRYSVELKKYNTYLMKFFLFSFFLASHCIPHLSLSPLFAKLWRHRVLSCEAQRRSLS